MYKFATLALWLVLLCTWSGCSSASRFVPVATLEPGALVALDVRGACEISGQAFLRADNGDIKRGAGSEVLLVPESAWTREWFEQVVQRGLRPEPEDYFADVAKFARRQRADIEGRFRFRDVPAGRWFVTCLITWKEAEFFQTMDWGIGLHPWRFRGGGRRWGRFGGGGMYPFYPCSTQVWERKETVGGFAFATADTTRDTQVQDLVVTR